MPLSSRSRAGLALCLQGSLSQSTATRLLQVLYVAAAVLAITLVVVISIAVVAWRKNKDTDLKS